MIRCSTLRLRHGGLSLLTDPWFSMRMAFLPCWRRPGLRTDEVGPLDAVLVSHLHPDHFDRGAMARLGPRPLRVIGPPGMLRSARSVPGCSFEELRPWTATAVGSIRVTAVPGPHGFPPPDEVNFVLDFPEYGRVFFGGDARFVPEVVRAVAERFAPVRLALLPVSGTLVFGRRMVMSPAQALEAARILRARTVIPIHEGGIWMSVPPLSLHPGRGRHLAALARRQGGAKVVVLGEGGGQAFAVDSSPEGLRY